MQVKWLIPVLVGGALLSACGSSPTASTGSVVATDIGPTSYDTMAPTQSTIPPVTGAPAEGQTSPTEQEYTIKPTDTSRQKVADLFGITVAELDAANVATPGYSAFYPGLKIKIPAGAKVPSATPDTTATTTPGATTPPATSGGPTTTLPPSGTCTPGTYVIVAGDLPSKVAAKFDVTVAQLDEANANTKGYKAFIVGVKINIPCP